MTAGLFGQQLSRFGKSFRYSARVERLFDTGKQSTSLPTASNTASHMAYRADNEYLDVLCEYGVFAAGLLVLAAISAIVRAYRYAIHNELAAGALIGICAVGVHSCVDFGLRVPANSILTLALVAVISSLRSRNDVTAPALSREMDPSIARQASFGIAGVLNWLVICVAACTILALGYALLTHKRNKDLAHTWKQYGYEAFREGDLSTTVYAMQRLANAMPGQVLDRLEAARVIRLSAESSGSQELQSAWLGQALDHYNHSRLLCPLAWEPQFWIAQYAERLDLSDSSVAYLKRARLLHPASPEIALELGRRQLDLGEVAQALDQFRDCLLISPEYASAVIDSLRTEMSPLDIAAEVLPTDVGVFVRAAETSSDPEERLAYLKTGLAMVDSGMAPEQEAAQVARLFLMLARRQDAVDHLRSALHLNPQDIALRIYLIQVLLDMQKVAEAEGELQRLLFYEPNNLTASKLQQRILQLKKSSLD